MSLEKHTNMSPLRSVHTSWHLMAKKHNLIRLIAFFDDAVPPVKWIIHQHWIILLMDPDIVAAVGSHPQITYRRGKSIRDCLVKSHYAPLPPQGSWLNRKMVGCFRCSGCSACPYITTGKWFVRNNTSKSFFIKHHISCRSTGVIYRATWPCVL